MRKEAVELYPSEPVLFQVDGFRKKFGGLEGMNDLVLQHIKKATSCRFLVRLSC